MNNKEKNISIKGALLSLIVCASILISYDILYAAFAYIFSSLPIDLTSDNKFDTLNTFGILVVYLIFAYLYKLSRKNEKRNTFFTFKKPKVKNYILVTLLVFSMMAVSDLCLRAYEGISGDRNSLDEVTSSIGMELDYYDEQLDIYENSTDKENEVSQDEDFDHENNSDDEGTSSDEDNSTKLELSEGDAKSGYATAYFWAFLAVVLIGAITEEVVMRGICFKLIEKVSGSGVAIILSGITFGIFHGNLAQGIYTTMIGIFLAALYYISKDFSLVCYAHILNNFLFTLPRLPDGVEDAILNSITLIGYVTLIPAIFILIKAYISTKKSELRNP